MKKFLREWVLPPAVFALAANSYQNYFLRPQSRSLTLLRRNKALRDVMIGRRCFVLGNGPSVSLQDLSLLQGELTIACNFFFNHPILEQWHPTVYCAADPIDSFGSTRYFESLLELVDSEYYIFHASVVPRLLASLGTESCSQDVLSKASRIFAFDCIHWKSVDDINFCDFLPPTWHTPMLSIMIAIYMGCSEIVLLGCDHSYYKQMLLGQFSASHFYKEDNPERLPSSFTYLEIAAEITKVFGGYLHLAEIAERKGVHIYDATADGCLDTFQKRKYESFF